MDAVYTVKETASILKCSENHVRDLQYRGVLRKCRGTPIRYRAKDVNALVGLEDVSFSLSEFRRICEENEALKAEVERLKGQIRTIFSSAGMAVLDLEKR